MVTLTFEMSGKKLLEELRSAERFNATMEQFLTRTISLNVSPYTIKLVNG